MQATMQRSTVGDTGMAEWEIPFKSVLGCLLQAGLLAARNGLGAQAETILRPVEAVRPGHASTRLARGLVNIYRERYQEAIDGLDQGLLREDPRHDMARAIKALGLYHLGRLDECRTLLKGLQDQIARAPQSVSTQARNLAASLAAETGASA